MKVATCEAKERDKWVTKRIYINEKTEKIKSRRVMSKDEQDKDVALEVISFTKRQVDCVGFVFKSEIIVNCAMQTLDFRLQEKADAVNAKLLELHALLNDIASHIEKRQNTVSALDDDTAKINAPKEHKGYLMG